VAGGRPERPPHRDGRDSQIIAARATTTPATVIQNLGRITLLDAALPVRYHLPTFGARACLAPSNWRVVMAYTCFLCEKNRLVGNKVSHSNIKSKTRQRPNLKRVKALVDGQVMHIRVCTRCLRSGKVTKAA
jgi:large subunit ribosomal protein L28